MSLNKAAIVKATLKREEVPVAGDWGGSVWVRILTVGERLALETSADSNATSVVRLVASALCDDQGQSVFTFEELLDVPGEALMQVRDAALKINGLIKEDLEKKVDTSDEAVRDASSTISGKNGAPNQ